MTDTKSVRVILTVTAAPGKAAEVAEAYRRRCAAVMQEPGCEQFEAFQSVADPHRFVVHERWADAHALEVHTQLNRAQTPGVRGIIFSNELLDAFPVRRLGWDAAASR